MTDDVKQAKHIVLDALALIAAAEREDRSTVELMLSTYGDDAKENGMLLGAILAHAVAILRTSATASGVEPAKLLGAVRASLRMDDDDQGDRITGPQ